MAAGPVEDEAWMVRHDRVREFADARRRYIAAAVCVSAAAASYRFVTTETLPRAVVVGTLAGVAWNAMWMGYCGQ